MRRVAPAGFAVLSVALATCSSSASPPPVDLAQLTLPPGFHIMLYAGDVTGARELALGAHGTVFVGSRDDGKVRALIDADHDGRAERVVVIASGLHLPSGVAFRDGDLYVGAVDRILRPQSAPALC